MNADGSNRRSLTGSLDRSVVPMWAGDGRSIFVSYDDHGEISRPVGPDGSITVAGVPPARVSTGLTLARPASRDGSVAYSGGTATSPPDVMLARGTGGARQLT